MSEFDADGFSAIDKFFGGETQDENGDVGRKGKNHQTRKRQGVGSSTPLKTSQNDLSKRLLMVGRKRQRADDEDDDDEDVGQKGKGRESEDDEEEEEEAGRTTIAQNKSTKNTSISNRPTTDSVLKKKLGKKERMKLQQGYNESAEKTLTDKETHEEKDSDLTIKATTATTETTTRGKDPSSLVDEENPSKKPKRRKVRSKQKNIRKDNRDKKPEHLIVGRKQYQGRPITAETRAKLNLPPPKPRLSHHIETPNPVQEPEDVHGTGLAIDDLLEDKGDYMDTKKVEKVSDKASKKRRKTKYKNLKL